MAPQLEPLNYPIYSLSLHFKLSLFSLYRAIQWCRASYSLALALSLSGSVVLLLLFV